MDQLNLLSHILESSIFSLIILVILAFMSVLSWGVGLAKMFEISRVNSNERLFQKKAKSVGQRKYSEIYTGSAADKNSVSGRIFAGVIHDYQRIIKNLKSEENSLSRIEVSELLNGKLASHVSESSQNLEKGLSLLASISNTAPFIGLLGTVLGITLSFQEIGLKGSANLAVVAPGISEALTATALGLFAAIPASLFYNFSRSRITKIKISAFAFGQNLVSILSFDVK